MLAIAAFQKCPQDDGREGVESSNGQMPRFIGQIKNKLGTKETDS